jgi:hypothetical protein
MCRKLLFLVLAVGFCLISSAHAATIIWVSDNKTPSAAGVAADQAWVDLLVAQGYTVDLGFRNKEGRTMDDTKIAALNAADLIIVSRDTNSGDYDDAQEITQWNSITTPILLQIAHIAGNNRWLWLDSGTNNAAQPTLLAVDSSHPVFNGVTLDANKQVNVLTTNSSFLSATAAGNGTLIATRADNGQVWIAEWQAGQAFYTGSTQTPAGPRMLFCSGGTTAPVNDGTYNLTTEGQTMFINAVRYMLGETDGPKKATRPDPKIGSLLVSTWATLGWTPGQSAASHDLYLGETFEDVNVGAAGAFRGNQTSPSFIVGLGLPGDPYPGGLVPGTTYYWRIDEVNVADPNSPWKGDVWSFRIAPSTAYDPNPADGAGSVALNATLKWTGGYGSKLHTVYFGDKFDDVNNASTGVMSGSTTYNPGALQRQKVYYWRVDEFDGAATHRGQVWSFATLGAVGNPYPSNGASSAEMNAILTWAPSDNAASHQLYFGTDKEAVRKADTSSPEYKGVRARGAESYDPGVLAWDGTYYWRVDEVNNVNPNSPWKGPLWSFTTGDFLLVDDFESYNDIDPPDPASHTIFDAWSDGFLTPTTNGALVGNNLPPYTQRANVHGGVQAMPLSYDNNLKFSEATLTLTAGRDWTRQGIGELSLWFRGVTTNAAERMYVALNGAAVVYHTDPSVTQKAGWTRWVIPLQQFTDLGVNLTNVTSIAIGFGTRGNTTAAGGTGQMYFDDIRLYRPAIAP